MPIVDAFMREMNATGFMSNRGRQVVASYLALDMKQDWREGAYYFEEALIDHDPSSNYGAWCSSAGVGAGRVLVFNTILQSTKFDPAGEYIRTWIPELANVPNDYIHDPWNMPKILQTNHKVQIGGEKPADSSVAHYPYPIPCDKYTSAEAAKKIKRSSPKSAKDKKMMEQFVAAKKR
jgi:deoxyribodipyrimidine photo-lyase